MAAEARRAGEDELFFEQVHPTPAGHRVLADALVEPVVALLAERRGERER